MMDTTDIQTMPNPADLCQPAADDRHEAVAEVNPSINVAVGEPKPEVRAHPRKAFPFKQLVAPVRNNQMPWLGDFIEVDCMDISQSGISLFLKRPPSYKELIVCLGSGATQTRMLARIVRVQEIDCDGRKGFAVGCQFFKRV